MPYNQFGKHLLVVHGEKGGVGKSLFARVLISYLHQVLQHSMDSGAVMAYDADGEGQGLQLTRTLPGTVPINLASPLSSAQILDRLVDDDRQVAAVLDLGGRQHGEFTRWMADVDIGELVADKLIHITVFWLLGGTVDSVVMLDRALDSFAECRLVVVRNRLFGEFQAFDKEAGLQARLQAHGALTMEFPVLSQELAQIIDQIGAPLHVVAKPAPAGAGFEQVGRSVQRMLAAWFGETCEGIDNSKAVPINHARSNLTDRDALLDTGPTRGTVPIPPAGGGPAYSESDEGFDEPSPGMGDRIATGGIQPLTRAGRRQVA